jgi:hypothetical protein
MREGRELRPKKDKRLLRAREEKLWALVTA